MSARAAAWALFFMGAAALAAGALLVALFLGLGAGAVYVTAPSEAHEDARRRNQAHRR